MIDHKYFDTNTPEGRRAQRTLLPMLKEIRKALAEHGIIAHCVNRYSYYASLEDGIISFDISLPWASDAEHKIAVDLICSMFNVSHVQRGREYFKPALYGYDSLVEMYGDQLTFAVQGTEMQYETFSFAM